MGRWPSNVILDEHAAAAMDEQSGHLAAGAHPGVRSADSNRGTYGSFGGQDGLVARRTDSGGASRFFHTFADMFKYQAKAGKAERPLVKLDDGTELGHPTVKPVALMAWLVTLITPPGGVTLDPFAGSGSTLQAASGKGFLSIGIERDPDYAKLIEKRLAAEKKD